MPSALWQHLPCHQVRIDPCLILCRSVGEQTVSDSTQVKGDQLLYGRWEIPPGDGPHVYLTWGRVRHTPGKSFIFEPRRDHTANRGTTICAASCTSKSGPPSPPNNQRACYVRWYQPIMNVMDWLFSNPSKYLPVTDCW